MTKSLPPVPPNPAIRLADPSAGREFRPIRLNTAHAVPISNDRIKQLLANPDIQRNGWSKPTLRSLEREVFDFAARLRKFACLPEAEFSFCLRSPDHPTTAALAFKENNIQFYIMLGSDVVAGRLLANAGSILSDSFTYMVLNHSSAASEALQRTDTFTCGVDNPFLAGLKLDIGSILLFLSHSSHQRDFLAAELKPEPFAGFDYHFVLLKNTATNRVMTRIDAEALKYVFLKIKRLLYPDFEVDRALFEQEINKRRQALIAQANHGLLFEELVASLADLAFFAECHGCSALATSIERSLKEELAPAQAEKLFRQILAPVARYTPDNVRTVLQERTSLLSLEFFRLARECYKDFYDGIDFRRSDPNDA